MSLFNDQAYLKLEEMIRSQIALNNPDAAEDLAFLKTALLAFCEYAFKVNEEQIETRFARDVLSGSELREVVEHFDGTRHTAHERAKKYISETNPFGSRLALFAEKSRIGSLETERDNCCFLCLGKSFTK